jgi:hypothetical protein
MTLKDKFENVALVYDKALNIVKNNVQVADEFAIDFANWVIDTDDKPVGQFTMKELLEIYKKEKGL